MSSSIGSGAPTPPLPNDAALEELEQAAYDAAVKAGAYVGGRFGGELEIGKKDDATKSLVTDVDRTSQQMIGELIASRFPDHLMIGEEDPPEQDPPAPEFVWAVDPVDGTTNFANGVPIYSVAVGVLHWGRPVAGACWIPWPSGEGHIVPHARLGGGAWLGRDRLRVRGPTGGAVPESGRVSLVPAGIGSTYRIGKELWNGIGEVRVTGSLVYELALVAAGGSQYMVGGFANVWDHAAGALLVQEAGGRVLTLEVDRAGRLTGRWVPLTTFDEAYDGSPNTFKRLRRWRRPLIAGSPGVADALARNLRLRRPSFIRRVRRAIWRARSRRRSG